MIENGKQMIRDGKTVLGVEFGSTRIKAVLIDGNGHVLASGSHTWENRFEDGVWTYHLEDAYAGLQDSYRKLADNIIDTYGEELVTVGAIGISAMMHGYLAFDRNGGQLAAFRTWRNTITEDAARELTQCFDFNIPQRWSIAHLYQAILNGEAHVKEIAFLTTLSGFLHWKLTGEKVLGIGDASGMFPINSETHDYDGNMLDRFDALITGRSFPWKLSGILPKVLVAGEKAGRLTAEGAKLIDPSGKLRPGIPMCPSEGDAGTGMVATNSVRTKTGNISAGTSIFAMLVLEKALSKVHEEIDMVTTPSGNPVAMVHCNNCSSDIDAWAGVFLEAANALGANAGMGQVLDTLFNKALEGDADCGGLVSYNYISGEHITHMSEGRPLFVRKPDAKFTFSNIARTLLYTAVATLRLGLDILTEEEKVELTVLQGHGGFFKAKGVGQKIMAGALSVPVTVLETAGEGGPWGIALLALYMIGRENDITLDGFLSEHIFAVDKGITVSPDAVDIKGFNAFMELYVKGLAVEKTAVENIL